MKEYYYQLAPIILAAAGMILGIFGYFIKNYDTYGHIEGDRVLIELANI